MTTYPDMDRLVPHRHPMQLVDRVIGEQDGVTRMEHVIGPDHAFLIPGKGVPVYAGFEMMAQSISATDGLRRWRAGAPPELGFLIGCRKYATARGWFQVGETLTIEVQCLLEGETASYQCRLLDAEGDEVSSAVVNVYQPGDVAAYLKGTAL